MTQINDKELEKTIEHHGAKLQATLRLPDSGPAKQVALMIHGSGEIDRNGNGMKMQLNTFNSLAESLAKSGIASLRFDKRGCAGSEGKYHDTGFFDFVDDADAWLQAMDSFEELDGAQRFLMGHSEGSLIAGFLSERNPTLQGQILLTPILENVEHAIERQVQQTLDEVNKLTGVKGIIVRLFLRLSGNTIKNQRRMMKRIKRSNKSSLKIRKNLINAKWLREVSSVDPRDVHRNGQVPTLSIGGEKDIQCVPQDAEEMAQLISAPVSVHMLSDLTHILRTDEEEPSIFRYKELVTRSIDERVPEIIIEWMQAHLTSPESGLAT